MAALIGCFRRQVGLEGWVLWKVGKSARLTDGKNGISGRLLALEGLGRSLRLSVSRKLTAVEVW